MRLSQVTGSSRSENGSWDVIVRDPAWAGVPVDYWLSNAVSRRVGPPAAPKRAGATGKTLAVAVELRWGPRLPVVNNEPVRPQAEQTKGRS